MPTSAALHICGAARNHTDRRVPFVPQREHAIYDVIHRSVAAVRTITQSYPASAARAASSIVCPLDSFTTTSVAHPALANTAVMSDLLKRGCAPNVD